jgi:hypothetical protein
MSVEFIEFLMNLSLLCLAFWAGMRVQRVIIVRQLVKILAAERAQLLKDVGGAIDHIDEMDEDDVLAILKDSAAHTNMVLVNAEKVQDTYYLYDIADNRFLGQGPTFHEAVGKLAEVAKDNVVCIIAKDEDLVLYIVNGEIKETL